MEVQDVAFGGLCSALAVLSPEQKEKGVLLIDLGGGTTDLRGVCPQCHCLGRLPRRLAATT